MEEFSSNLTLFSDTTMDKLIDGLAKFDKFVGKFISDEEFRNANIYETSVAKLDKKVAENFDKYISKYTKGEEDVMQLYDYIKSMDDLVSIGDRLYNLNVKEYRKDVEYLYESLVDKLDYITNDIKVPKNMLKSLFINVDSASNLITRSGMYFQYQNDSEMSYIATIRKLNIKLEDR